MGRPPRINAPNLTFHVVQRGNDRNRTFFDDEDFRTYLLLLCGISRRYSTCIHAYVLMSNHVHLLLTTQKNGGISLTMQHVTSSYARYINERYGRTGTLWGGRYRSSAVDSDYYCLACYRYIELNPVRAGIVAHASDYHWSSHRENIGRRGLSVVAPHPSYLALHADQHVRQNRYAALFRERLAEATVDEIRRHTTSGAALGSASFRETIERRTGIRLSTRNRGRPKKESKQVSDPFTDKGV